MLPATSPSCVQPKPQCKKWQGVTGNMGFSFSLGLAVGCRVVLLSGQSDLTVMLLLLSFFRLWVPEATILCAVFRHGGYHCLGREKRFKGFTGSPSISAKGQPPWWPFSPWPLLKLSSSLRQQSFLESLVTRVRIFATASSPGGAEMGYIPQDIPQGWGEKFILFCNHRSREDKLPKPVSSTLRVSPKAPSVFSKSQKLLLT